MKALALLSAQMAPALLPNLLDYGKGGRGTKRSEEERGLEGMTF